MSPTSCKKRANSEDVLQTSDSLHSKFDSANNAGRLSVLTDVIRFHPHLAIWVGSHANTKFLPFIMRCSERGRHGIAPLLRRAVEQVSKIDQVLSAYRGYRLLHSSDRW